MSLRTVIVKMEADISGVTSAMNDVKSTVSGTSKGISDGMNMLSNAMKSVVKNVGGMGITALKAGDKMNNTMGGIQAQTGQADYEIAKLNRSVRDLALTQGRFSAQKMMDALDGVAIYGQNTQEQLILLDAAMLATDATGTKLEKSAYLLGSTLLKFGQDASYAEMWTGKFAAAQRFTNTEMGDMVKALGKAAPTMNMHNLSVQQGGTGYARLAATMAVAQQEMMTHTQSARGFEVIMNTLNSAILNGSEMMDKIGVATRNADGTARDHFDALDDLKNAFDGLTDEMQYALVEYMELGVYGEALFDVMRRQYGLIGNLSYEMTDLGHAMDMAGARTGGFGDVLGVGRSILDEFFLIINDVIGLQFYEWAKEGATQLKEFFATARENGTIERLAESVMRFVEAAVNLSKEIMPIVMEWLPKLIDKGVRVAEIVGENAELILGLWAAFKGYTIVKSVIGIFGGLKDAAGLLKGKKAIGGLSPAMSKAVGAKAGGKGILGGAGKLLKAMGPKGWAVGAIVGGSIATIRAVSNQREQIAESFDEMYEITSSTTQAMAYSAAVNMGLMSEKAQSKTRELMKKHGYYFEYMYNQTGDKAQAMAAVTSRHFEQLKNEANANLNQLYFDSIALWESVYHETGDSAKATAAVADAGFTRMKKETRSSLAQLERDYQYYGEALPKGMAIGIERGEPTAFTVISDFARGIGDRFRSFFGINSPSSLMTEYGLSMGAGVENGLNNSQDGIRNAVTDIGNNLRDQWDNLRRDADSYGNRTGSGFSSGLERARNGIMNTARNIANTVTNTLSRALSINSPSRVMIELGEFTGEGYKKGLANMVRDISGVSNQMALAALPSLHTQHDYRQSPYSSELNGTTININIPEMTIREEADIDYIARQLANQLRREQRAKGLAW